MSRNLTLAPLESSGDDRREAYARLTRTALTALVRAMPDAQSGILTVLTWHALRNSRLRLGPLAGRTAAGVSGEQLVEILGRPLRTVRHALAQLGGKGLVAKEAVPPGHKNVYTLPWLTAGSACPPSETTPEGKWTEES